MRVIICGAGEVGYNIAAYLARDENDITLIDTNAEIVAQANHDLDVRAVLGHASTPEVLSAAGAAEADMIIAVTSSDEVNMIACQVAHSLFNVPKKIARIRASGYLDPIWANLFSRAHMPIDVIISPEQEIALSILKRLSVPGTTNIISLAGEKLHLCAVICEEDCPIVNTPLRQLTALFPDARINIMAINRGGVLTIPDPDDQMLIGDEVFFVVDTDQLDRALEGFGHEEKTARSIVIMGGGNIGFALACCIQEKFPHVNLKLIEQNHDRALELSEKLEDVVVLCGDGLDHTLLEEADMKATETLIAVTDDDEANILGSLLARQYGCDQTVTLLNKNTYNALQSSLGLGAIVSPRAITASKILHYVRRGRIKAVHNIAYGGAEVIEAELSESSDVINKPLKDIPFTQDVHVGAIVREDNEVLMPHPDLELKAGDHVIVIALQGAIRKVEKMFSIQVDLFS